MRPLDQLLALMRWKRMILFNTILVAAASVVVALVLPKTFRSTVSVFPPEDESFNLGSLSSIVSAAALGGGSRRNLPVWSTPSDVYAAVLRSRTVREEIIRRYDLMTLYKSKDIESALRGLAARSRVRVTGEGIISVQVDDRSPQRAADVANTFIELLDKVNREKRRSAAGNARAFIENRLAENRSDLGAAEDTLRAVQERTGVLVPEPQMTAVINAAAALQAQLSTREVDLQLLRGMVGPDHPDLRAAEREVATLRRKAAEADAGLGAGAPQGAMEIPLRQYPARTIAYMRAEREVKVQEAVYEFLVQQFENYRIQETRDTPTVQVLDRAVPAMRKSAPIRWLICAVSTGLAFLASLCLAALLEMLGRMRDESPEQYAKVRRLAGELRLHPLFDRL